MPEFRRQGLVFGQDVRTLKGLRGDSLVVITLVRGGLHIQSAHADAVGLEARRGGDLLTRPVSLSAFPGTPVVMGDAVFDDSVRVRADNEYTAVAVLTAATRAALCRLMSAEKVIVHRGSVDWLCRETRLVWKPTETVALLRGILELLDALTLDPATLKDRLMSNAMNDPHPNVRLKNLLLVQRRYPNDDQVRAGTRAAMADVDPLVRLRARLYFGFEDLGPALNDLKSAPVEDYLNESLIESASVLSAMGSAEGESLCVTWLKSPSEDLRIAAARALGTLGTVRSVGPLQSLAESLGATRLRATVRESIDQIKSRVAPGKQGSVSLPMNEGSAGDLSLEPDTGQISFSSEIVRFSQQPDGAVREPPEAQGE